REALKYKDADYSALEAAIDAASSEVESWYTPETWAPFAEALAAAEEAYEAYDSGSPLDINHQSEIDAIKDALVTAQKGLIVADGDYTKVYEAIDSTNDLDESKYTADSWQALQDAIDSVVYNLNAKEQERIDGFADAINTAIKNLKEKGADYTEVNAIIKEWNEMDKSLYTEASILNVANTVNAVDWNLPVSKQAVVDGYVVSIRAAINALEYKPADYTKVNAAEAKAKEAIQLQKDFAAAHNGYLYYTKETMDALEATLNYTKGLDIRYQDQVDKYAEAIETAINVLKYKPADYTDVNKALSEIPSDLSIYTDDSVQALNDVVNSIDKYLDIRYQSTVDGYASSVRAKIGALKTKGADYTAVIEAVNKGNAKIAEGIYTDESVAVLNKAISDVQYNLDITKQAQVDAYAQAINDAISKLVVKFVPADYTQVDSEIGKIPSDLTVYTDETVAALNAAVNAVDRSLGKDQQATVDGYAESIKTAREALKYKNADYSAVETAKTKVPADSSLYTAESWQNLQNKINAVVEGLDITQQSRVDAFAKDIEDAIAALRYVLANYDEVTKAKGEIPSDLSLYTDETVAKLNEVLNGIDYTLDITKQATVDTYPPAIREAIKNLKYKPADYTAVDAAKEKVPTDSSLYTEESWQELQDKLNAVRTGLDITHQAEVDKFASDIEDALENLEYVGANYDDVRKAIQEANDTMDEKLHTAASRAAVRTAINLVDYTLDITKQATVDGYAAAIRKAVSELEYNPADYSAVNTAKGKVPKDSSIYTAESWQNLQDKLAAVKENLDIRYQAQVNGYAADIEQAITDLKYLPADYTKLRQAVDDAEAEIKTGYYTKESVSSLESLIASINWELDIRDQKKVDLYEQSVRAGIEALKLLPADYTAVDNAITAAKAEIDKGWYTDESVAKLQEAIDSVVTGYTKNRQSEVDEFAQNIVKATNDLVKKLANYTELQKILDLLDNSSSEIYNNTYKNFDEVMALIASYRENTVKNNMNLTVDKQSTVDEMTATLQGYIDSLEPETAKEVFEAKEGSTTVIKDGYIYGLSTGMTKSAFQSKFITYENVELKYSGNSGRFLGTGTTVKVISSITGEEIASYIIIIYGDVDGNGLINTSDLTIVSKAVKNKIVLSVPAKKAARLVSRTSLTVSDYTALKKVVKNEASVNQVTGKIKR
ncbi:MAG TPA: hypothetical protein DIW36_06070, partial [Ruminococcaceae bacterium]|nr:hypothetical protein [Oscillospiraceae bacterium]